MQTGVILRRKSGLAVPDQYLELALKNNPHSWGAAIVADGKLQTNHGDQPSDGLIKETIAAFEKSDITFYLGNSDSAVNLDDVSPYILFSKDDDPELVAFITGKFPGREQAGSSHPAEFFMVNQYLIPKLQSFYELTDGNIPKIMEQIKKPIFRDDLLGNALDQCAVTFVANTGEAVSYSKGDAGKEYPWGWVSNHYGFQVEGAKTEAKKGMFGGRSTVREKAPVAASPAVTGTTAVAPPKTEASVIKRYEVVKWSPAKTLSRKDRKLAFKSKIGYIPHGHDSGVEVEVYKDTETNKLLTFSEVKALGLAAVGLPTTHNPPRVKDTEVENIPQPAQKPLENKKVESSLIPIMSPATREHIKKIMADAGVQKMINENADIIEDPKVIQKLEEQFASFSTQLGAKSIDDYYAWSYEMMFNLAKERPDGLAVMCWTFRNIAAAYKAKAARATPAATVGKEEEVQPQKKGMFGQRKAG